MARRSVPTAQERQGAPPPHPKEWEPQQVCSECCWGLYKVRASLGLSPAWLLFLKVSCISSLLWRERGVFSLSLYQSFTITFQTFSAFFISTLSFAWSFLNLAKNPGTYKQTLGWITPGDRGGCSDFQKRFKAVQTEVPLYNQSEQNLLPDP